VPIIKGPARKHYAPSGPSPARTRVTRARHFKWPKSDKSDFGWERVACPLLQPRNVPVETAAEICPDMCWTHFQLTMSTRRDGATFAIWALLSHNRSIVAMVAQCVKATA
jgi:hypothetical protein